MVLGHALDQSGLKWSPPEHFFQNMAKRCQKNAIGQLSQRLDEYVEMNIELNIFLDKVEHPYLRPNKGKGALLHSKMQPWLRRMEPLP